MRPESRSADREVARIASRQHGSVTLAQLLAAGLSRPGVRRRLEKGLLHREFPGVYRVGHRAPGTDARFMAAVLACGGGSLLSGKAALFLYELIRITPLPEVTTTRDRRVRGVISHRVRRLDPRDITSHRRIPVTTIPRTLIDPAYDRDDYGRLCHEAQVRYRVNATAVYDALARRPTAPGAANVHWVFRGDGDITLSVLERAFLALLREAGLPPAVTNRHEGGRYVDCRWPQHHLSVELDSYTYHHTRHAWEGDQRREREARARGDEFRRYTWAAITDERELVVADLRRLLSEP
jgi:hypothetical protein